MPENHNKYFYQEQAIHVLSNWIFPINILRRKAWLRKSLSSFHSGGTILIPKDLISERLPWTKAHKIIFLPNNMHINGDFYIGENLSNLRELPTNLSVLGNLEIRSGRFSELPSGLNVGGFFDVGSQGIEELPSDLVVKGRLNLAGTFVKRVRGEISGGFVLGQSVNHLQKTRRFNGSMYLRDVTAKDILKDVQYIAGSLVLDNVNISSLAPFMEVCGNLIVSGASKIEKRTSQLSVGGELRFVALNYVDQEDFTSLNLAEVVNCRSIVFCNIRGDLPSLPILPDLRKVTFVNCFPSSEEALLSMIGGHVESSSLDATIMGGILFRSPISGLTDSFANNLEINELLKRGFLFPSKRS